MLGHDGLLIHVTVVLQGKNNWIIRCLGGEKNQKKKGYRNQFKGKLMLPKITAKHTLKAYSLMALIASLKRIFEVKVYPW